MAHEFYGVAEIEEVLEEVRTLEGQIRGLLKLAKDNKMKGQLWIDGEKELRRGIEKIELWAANGLGQFQLMLPNPARYATRTEALAKKEIASRGEDAAAGKRTRRTKS